MERRRKEGESELWRCECERQRQKNCERRRAKRGENGIKGVWWVRGRNLLAEGADPTIKTSVLLHRHHNITPMPGRPPTVELPTSSPAQLAFLRNIAFR